MLTAAPAPPRSPWQLVYGAAHRLRRRWWARRAEHLPRPVVSVGNLLWGGGGKTPLVAAIAGGLRDRGLRVAVLSRGYGSRGHGVRLVSSGEGPLLGPRLAGDEPVLLAGELPGVAVVVGADRYRAGIHALERLSPAPEVFVLDDGFSHLRLARDLDLLALPADDPFGGGRLAPSGRLREPLAASRHADAALVTGGEPGLAAEIGHALGRFGFSGPAFDCPFRVLPARGARGERPRPGDRVVLVVGIARPERVLRAAAEQPFEIVDTLVYRDHHDYPDASLDRIRRKFVACKADWVLTTGKDRVKLLGRLEEPLAELPLVAEPEAAFWDWLAPRVERQAATP